MRNLRTLIACALGVLLVGSALSAAEGDDSGVMARIAKLESDMKKVNDARGGGAGLGANQLPFIIDGFIDFTGNYNFNRSPNRDNLLRGYDAAADTFNLNVAHLAFHRAAAHGSPVGFAVEVDMGTDASADNVTKGGSSGNYFDLQEAYIDLMIPQDEDCGLTVGKFVTFEGIEVVENTANPVISRGFLFGYAEPVSHVGFFAHYNKDVNGKGLTFTAKLGAVNGWDLEVDNNKDKTFIWFFGMSQSGLFDVHFNGTWGDEQASLAGHRAGHPRLSLDLTGFVTMQMLTLNFQVNSGQETKPYAAAKHVHWFGFALEPVVDFANQLPGFKLGGRFEMFDDVDGARLNGLGSNEPQTVYNVTVAPAYTVRDTNLTIRAEYRYDASNLNRGQNNRAFADSKGLADVNHQNTVMIEFLYTFTTQP